MPTTVGQQEPLKLLIVLKHFWFNSKIISFTVFIVELLVRVGVISVDVENSKRKHVWFPIYKPLFFQKWVWSTEDIFAEAATKIMWWRLGPRMNPECFSTYGAKMSNMWYNNRKQWFWWNRAYKPCLNKTVYLLPELVLLVRGRSAVRDPEV